MTFANASSKDSAYWAEILEDLQTNRYFLIQSGWEFFMLFFNLLFIFYFICFSNNQQLPIFQSFIFPIPIRAVVCNHCSRTMASYQSKVPTQSLRAES